MFNILERRFNIFWISVLAAGYLFIRAIYDCGSVCYLVYGYFWKNILWMDLPQTIFLEMVFVEIEFWIEGDRGAQIRLSKQEWNAEKIRKKGFKWTIFLLISFGIANVFFFLPQ
jgi:polyferredoxin